MRVIKDKSTTENLIYVDWCFRMGKHKNNCSSTIIFKLNKFKDKVMDNELSVHHQNFKKMKRGDAKIILLLS